MTEKTYNQIQEKLEKLSFNARADAMEIRSYWTNNKITPEYMRTVLNAFNEQIDRLLYLREIVTAEIRQNN